MAGGVVGDREGDPRVGRRQGRAALDAEAVGERQRGGDREQHDDDPALAAAGRRAVGAFGRGGRGGFGRACIGASGRAVGRLGLRLRGPRIDGVPVRGQQQARGRDIFRLGVGLGRGWVGPVPGLAAGLGVGPVPGLPAEDGGAPVPDLGRPPGVGPVPGLTDGRGNGSVPGGLGVGPVPGLPASGGGVVPARRVGAGSGRVAAIGGGSVPARARSSGAGLGAGSACSSSSAAVSAIECCVCRPPRMLCSPSSRNVTIAPPSGASSAAAASARSSPQRSASHSASRLAGAWPPSRTRSTIMNESSASAISCAVANRASGAIEVARRITSASGAGIDVGISGSSPERATASVARRSSAGRTWSPTSVSHSTMPSA